MKFNRFYLIVLVPFLLVHCQDAFGNAREELRKAATLFHEEQYEEALQTWQKLAPSHASGNLYYNMGIAESKLNQTPQAIYAFEQALRFHPGNHDYRKALEDERKKIDDATVPIQPFFLGHWIDVLLSSFRPGTWVFAGLIFGLIALVLVIPDMRSKISFGRFLQPAIIPWLAGIGVILIVLGFLSYQRLYDLKEAVLMQKCEIRQAASAESPPLRNVSAGETVKIKDELGEWVYVSLLNLDYGWIKKDCIQVIRIK